MLQILMDDSEGHRLFSVKVDPGQNGFRLPDYNAIIKKPMDLGTVEKELLNGTLKTPDLFIEGKKQNLKKNSYKLLLLFIFWKLKIFNFYSVILSATTFQPNRIRNKHIY